MSKLIYTCFIKLIIDHFLSCNKNIPYEDLMLNALADLQSINLHDTSTTTQKDKVRKVKVLRNQKSTGLSPLEVEYEKVIVIGVIKRNNDETNDSEDLDMDLSDDEPNKGDDDVAGFGIFVDNKSQELAKFTPFSPVEMFPNDVDHHTSSSPANTTHDLVTKPQHKPLQAKAKMLMAKAKHNIGSLPQKAVK
ncbi:hypothetical protein Tco_0417039 [Tanacetum coccineum]